MEKAMPAGETEIANPAHGWCAYILAKNHGIIAKLAAMEAVRRDSSNRASVGISEGFLGWQNQVEHH